MILTSKNKILIVKEEIEDFSVLSQDESGLYKEKWIDKCGFLHREDGPATIIVRPDGIPREDWYKHGHKHREDGPAFYDSIYEGWMINGHYHREDGPAFIDKFNKIEYYYLNGLPTTEEAVRALGKMK